jgi:NADH/F420H2 dehydrogenase subunit C
MLPPLEEIKSAVEQKVSGSSPAIEGGALVLSASHLSPVCSFLKDDERFKLDYLANLTAADYPPERIEVVYHLYSMSLKHGPLMLKVKLPRENPAVASVTPVWRGAEFQEREVFDLYGVAFEGHPDLRRILMWDGFEGHPLRKDYVIENQDILKENG